MTEKQQKLLGLFKEIDSICKRHGLRYVMAGGTLLGVVRNEGFLPWDDDMDICMPRDDWNKFVEICKTELPKNRVLSSVELDRSFTNSFPRYGDTTGCAIHKHQIISEDVAGEVIDVFTLDPIPDDPEEHRKYCVHMMIYSDLINMGAVFGNRWDVPAGLYLKYLLMYLFLGKDRTLSRLERLMFSHKEEECSRYVMRWGGCPFLFDKDMMFPVKYGKFQDMEVMVPNHTNAYLTWHYGDEWSYVPPHGEREAHETISLMEGSYRELRSDYMEKASRKRWIAGASVRKLYYIATAKKRYRLHKERSLYQAKSIVMDLRVRLKECGHTVGELLEQRDFATLSHLFSRYFQVQLSPGFIGREDFSNIYLFNHPILIEVEDEVFYAAALTLFYTEKISKAYRLLEVRKSQRGLTGVMEALVSDVDAFRVAVNEYDYGSKEKAENILDGLMGKYSGVPSFLKFKCRFVMERAEAGDTQEAERFLSGALREFPEDGYYMKYQGDLYLFQGQRQKAWELYADAREHTANGMVHLEIEKELRDCREEAFLQCREDLAQGQTEKALALMKLWQRLLPEDRTVQGYALLAKASAILEGTKRTGIPGEILEALKNLKEEPDENIAEDWSLYKEALTTAWIRLGYDAKLASLYTEAAAEEPETAGALEAQMQPEAFSGEKRAQAFKILGDIRMKQGRSGEAFGFYFKSWELAKGSWLREELSLIFLTDLYENGRRISVYGKNADVRGLLSGLLDKYGTLEELLVFVEQIGQ